MASLNKVHLIGNIGKKEVKTTSLGTKVVNISVATSYRKKDSDQDITEWHNVCFFLKLADVADMYLQKGMQVYIEGQLKTDKWQTQSGENRYSTKIIAQSMQMLGKKADNENQKLLEDTPPTESLGKQDYEKAKEGGFPDDDIPF